MKCENYFKDMFESVPEYTKIVLLIFLIQNHSDLLKECGFLKSDISRLTKQLKTTLIEQTEEYLDHIKNEEQSKSERSHKKQMAAYFSNLFDDIRCERSLTLLLSLADPDILKQNKFTDDERFTRKNFAFEKLHRRKFLKECLAL